MKSNRNNPLLTNGSVSTAFIPGALLFVFFLLRFFIYARNRQFFFSPAVAVYYTLTYEYGPIPRAFIGWLISLFTGYLTRDTLMLIITVTVLFTLGLASLMLGKIASRLPAEEKPSMYLFLLLLATAPLSHTYLVERHFGRLDIFLLLWTLLGLLCLRSPRLRWLVPFLGVMAVATHPGYVVTYLPALAIPLLYEVHRSKYSRSSIALFTVSGAVILGAFIYFQFLSPAVPFKDAEAFGRELAARTDMKISNPVLYLEYISPHLDNPSKPDIFWGLEIPMAKNIALPSLFVLFAFSIPLIAVFAAVWRSSFRLGNDRLSRIIYILCAAAPLAFIPAALFAQDWERWWVAALNCQFILLFYLLSNKDSPVRSSIRKVYDYFGRHTLVLLCILVFSGTLMLSNITSFTLDVLDKSIWQDFFAKVLPNYDFSL